MNNIGNFTLRDNQLINQRITQRLGVERDVQFQKGCHHDANHQTEIPKTDKWNGKTS